MHDTGTWPSTSGAPRTRDFQRWKVKPFAYSGFGSETSDQAIGFDHILPPSRSRFPVSAFSTSTSHEASVPNSWLQSPMRP